MNTGFSARRKGLKLILTAIVVIALTATVSACGRKGPLELPEEMQAQ